MSVLDYRVSGVSDPSESPTTLYLHGFLGRGSDWHGMASTLGGRSIAPDLPGHGDSVGLPTRAYTMEGAAGAVLDILDETGTRTCGLVGYSMGGRLALYLALRHPERFTYLVLESSSPGLKSETERTERRRSDAERAELLENADTATFRSFLEGWHRQPLFASLEKHEGIVEELVSDRLHNDPGELARSLRGMGTGSQPSLWGELPRLRVPTLAVAGELDEKFAGIAYEMSGLAESMEVAVVGGAGHNVHVEKPEEFVRLLKRGMGGG